MQDQQLDKLTEFSINPLTKSDEDFCTYTSIFGCLIAISAIFQTFVIAVVHWVTFLVFLIYFFISLSYYFLGRRKRYAPVLLIVCTGLLVLLEILYFLTGLFSLTLLLLLFYTLVITVILFGSKISKRLRDNGQFEEEENQYWKGKV